MINIVPIEYSNDVVSIMQYAWYTIFLQRFYKIFRVLSAYGKQKLGREVSGKIQELPNLNLIDSRCYVLRPYYMFTRQSLNLNFNKFFQVLNLSKPLFFELYIQTVEMKRKVQYKIKLFI